MITATSPNNKNNSIYIQKRVLAINEAVKKALPFAAKAIANALKVSKQTQLDALVGTQNKSGKTSSSGHVKMRDTMQILKFSDSPIMSRYDISIGAPYWNWIENGANAAFGLPWSHPSGKKTRDFSKSTFKGYHALEKGLQKIVGKNLQLQITKSLINNELRKVKGLAGGKK